MVQVSPRIRVQAKGRQVGPGVGVQMRQDLRQAAVQPLYFSGRAAAGSLLKTV